jgi:hypothetical protein
MSTATFILGLRAKHSSGRTCQPNECDTCKLMEVLDNHRQALERLQELNSKGQYTQEGFASVIREGLGTKQRETP